MNGLPKIIIIFNLLSLVGPLAAQSVYKVQSAKVEFHSAAPKELITAASGQLRGLVDIDRRTFAFRIDMASFRGFNSPLQQEHFNENYMETSVFPEALFSGKIIEPVDLSKNGTYPVRAKGKLSVHGLSQERIIKTTIIVKGRRLLVDAAFVVALMDHNIKIPRIVYDKLAPDIDVVLHAEMAPGR